MPEYNSSNILNYLQDALESHDWFYHMSDSPRPYQAGKAEAAHISYLTSLASSFQLGDEAKTLYSFYYKTKYLDKI